MQIAGSVLCADLKQITRTRSDGEHGSVLVVIRKWNKMVVSGHDNAYNGKENRPLKRWSNLLLNQWPVKKELTEAPVTMASDDGSQRRQDASVNMGRSVKSDSLPTGCAVQADMKLCGQCPKFQFLYSTPQRLCPTWEHLDSTGPRAESKTFV